ncbi:DUF3010 family protein [Agrobacterium rubi]|nr:DUF3010 family protein [Agrobacterium rubi]NTF24626.1 DUF3010 family protein [Agrobacterium rubi]
MVKVMGIDFEGKTACFVVVAKAGDDTNVVFKERAELAETRSRDDMVLFRDAVRRIMKDAAPDRISIRGKLENGQMRAGAAALKMEAIILAESTVDVAFVSSVKAKKQPDADGLFGYLQPAFRAAMAGLADGDQPPKNKKSSRSKSKS